jgi:predicted dehydrogenase
MTASQPSSRPPHGALARRRFLGGAAVGGFTILLPRAGRSWAAAADRPVFATIGLRNQGWTITSKSFPFADFAALADVDADVLAANVDRVEKETGRRPAACADYRTILDRKDIDAVMIATPDHWHAKMALEAMAAGKDVYCEKPLTLTIDEGKRIERAVEQTGRVFQVGTMQRTECESRFLQAIALVRAGRIGRVKKVTCGIDSLEPSPVIPEAPVPRGLDWDAWLGPAPATAYRALPEIRQGYGGGVPLYSNCHYSFRNWQEYAGGKLTDWGAHHVDIACWALGMTETGPSRVEPLEFTLPVPYRDGYPTEADRYNAATEFTIRVAMPDDVEMIITSKGDNGILFEGEKGRFFVNRSRITGKPVEALADQPLPEDAIEAVYGGPVARNHTDNFVAAIRSRQQPISDVWSHNRMLEICHLANIAMRLGRALDWDPVKREIVGDAQASSFLARESRKGYETDA